jgi:hypothetical protein
VQPADGEQARDALGFVLADADEDPVVNGNAELAGLGDHAHALLGILVGRVLVRHAVVAQRGDTFSSISPCSR